MNKVIAFILGMVFGIIIILGAIAGVLYYGGVILTPAKVSESTRDYIGDLADLSLYDMYKLAKKLYTEKAGQMVDDKYYSLGDFMADNNINLDAALGFEIPQSVKDIPLLEYFNGQNGLQNALGQIKVSVLPDIVNLFTTTDEAGNKIVNQSAIDKLSNYSVTDLMGKNGIVEVFAEVTLCELLPQTFPQTKSETNQIMYALGQTQIGKAVNAFMSGGTNLYLELKDPKPGTTTPGALAELGKITFTSLVGSGDATLNAVLEGKTIADIIDDSGNITTDPVINDLQIGRLLGLTYNEETDTWTKSDGTPADSMYAAIAGITVGQVLKGQGINDICLGDLLGFVRNKITDVSAYTESFVFTDEQGNTTLTVLRNPATDAYVLAAPAKEGEQPVWYEAEFFCADEMAHTSTHSKDCYVTVWYSKAVCSDATHVDETTHKDGGCGKLADGWHKKADALYGFVARLTVGEITSGVTEIIDAVKDIPIGELVGKDALQGVAAAFAELTVNQIINGEGLKSLYIGELLGNVRYEVTDIDGTYSDVVANVKQNGDVVVRYDGEKWYVAELTCTDDTAGHVHTDACYTYNWYVKCADGCAHDASTHVVIDGANHTKADALYNTLGNITIGDLTGGSSTALMDKLTGLTIEEIVGKDNISGVMANIAHMTIKELTSAEGLNGLYLGSFLGNVRCEVTDLDGYADVVANVMQNGANLVRKDGDKWYVAELTCVDDTVGHVHTDKCYGFVWYVKCADGCAHEAAAHVVIDGANHVRAEALYNALGSVTIGDLTSGSVQTLTDKITGLTLADIVGKNNISGIMENFADMTVNELMNGGIDGMYFGQLFDYKRNEVSADGYTATTIDDILTDGTNYARLDGDKLYLARFTCEEEHVHSTKCYGFVWYTDATLATEASGIQAQLANYTVADIDQMDAILKDMTLHDVLGDDVPDMLKDIQDVKIGNLQSSIDKMYLGSFLKYSRNALDEADLSDTTTDGIKVDGGVFAKLDNGKYYQANLDCDQAHAHTADCYKFVWYTDDTLATVATGVTGKLANTKISNLSNLNDEIQNFTLADVLGEDGVPQMLDSLKHTKIKDMETALDETYLGGFFKYYRKAVNQAAFSDTETDGIKVNGGVIAKADGDNYYIAKLICEQTHTHTASCYGFEWYTDSACSVLATGITAKLADEQVKNLGNLQDKIMTFTLKDVMGDDVPSVLKSIQDTKLSDLNGAIDQMYLGDMLGNHRVEVDDLTGYADVISGTVKQNGSLYAKIDSDVWYEADIVCDETHTHTADCFDYNWYDETDAKLDGVIASVASVKVGDMDGDTITAKVNNMKLGEVLTINSSSPQILQTLKDTRIGKLSDKVDTLTLGDVITIDGSSSTLLQNLKDKQITNLSSEIDNLTIDKVIDIDDSSPQILQTLKTKGTKISELGTAMNDLTIGDVVDVDAPGTSKILVELSDKKVDELGTAINGLYLGTAMNYNRKEITDISSYGITVCADVVSDGTRYARLYNGKYYQATYDCSQPHTHTAECYGFVWYTDEACTTTVSGVTAAFVNSKMDNISATIDNLTLAKLGIGAGNNLLMAVQDVPINDLGTALNKLDMGVMFGYKRMQVTGSYNIVVGNVYKNNNDANSFATMIDATLYLTHLECHDATHTATTHTEECFNVVWFEACDAADAEYTGADGIDADNPTQGYRAVKGIYAKLSNKSLTDMSGGNGLQDVVETLTIGDFIASGMLTMSDEQQYKLDVMFEGGEHSFTENGFTYEISLSGYFQYKAMHSAVTAKDFFNKATHDEDCRYKWHELTLDQFLSTLLNAI